MDCNKPDVGISYLFVYRRNGKPTDSKSTKTVQQTKNFTRSIIKTLIRNVFIQFDTRVFQISSGSSRGNPEKHTLNSCHKYTVRIPVQHEKRPRIRRNNSGI